MSATNFNADNMWALIVILSSTVVLNMSLDLLPETFDRGSGARTIADTRSRLHSCFLCVVRSFAAVSLLRSLTVPVLANVKV